MTKKSFVYILILILLSIFTAFSPNFNYKFPFHADEWDNIKISQEIIKEEKIIEYNPFLENNPYYLSFNEEAHGVENTNSAKWEINYNLFIALASLFTGISPLEIGILLPTLFVFIMSFNTFILVRYLTKKDTPAILSAIFIITLKTNLTYLGPWFLAASSFGLAFIPSILYLFIRSLDSKKYAIVFFSVFAITTLAHPASTIIFLPIFSIYLILNPEIIKKNKNFFLISIALLIVLLLIILPFDGSATGYIDKIFKILTFPRSAPINGFVSVMQFPVYMGILAFALSIYGFSKTITEKEMMILPLSVDALLPLILGYIYLGYAFLAPYERIVVYISEFLMILAGIGLYNVFLHLKKGKLACLLVVIVMVLQINSLFVFNGDIPLVIEQEEYSPILWLKDNTPQDAVILATPRSSEAIGVIADRNVISLMRGRLGSSEESINKTLEFFRGNNEKREEILIELKPDYIYSREKLNLSSIKLVHFENNSFIYEVR
ncbi:MAG: hypothetical protein O8C64_03080 [Candidatus Methanoperedens sp.]|nr:hypothetical protein [Candidatus Methanoperedens sp.]MCZ7405644.1 hypothetical protein [Candidatus Methanoperedens sp.]